MTLHSLMQAGPAKANELFSRLAETSGTALKTRERLFAELKSELELHVDLEEKHLFPILRKQPETKELVVAAIRDNKDLRAKVAELDALPRNDESFLAKVSELQKAFRQHARDEKRELLPAVQKALSDEQVQGIVEKIEGTLAEADQAREGQAEEKRAAARREREEREQAELVAQREQEAEQERADATRRAEAAARKASRAAAQQAELIAEQEQEAEQERVEAARRADAAARKASRAAAQAAEQAVEAIADGSREVAAGAQRVTAAAVEAVGQAAGRTVALASQAPKTGLLFWDMMMGMSAPRPSNQVATRGPTAQPSAPPRQEHANEEVIPLAEEVLVVGKRTVETGTTRIRRYIVETPVEQQVTLVRERVVVERRRPTTNTVTGETLTELTVEVTETDEVPVIAKSVQIREEIVVRTERTEHVETVRDTVRQNEVAIEDASARRPARARG